MAGDATADRPLFATWTHRRFSPGPRRLSELPRVPRRIRLASAEASPGASHAKSDGRTALDDGSEQANPSARARGRAGAIGDALHSAAAGSGRIVVIEGAPGIGKSSLLGEAAELAEAERMAVLRARGGAMEREFALGVVIQLLAPSIEPLTERERERAFTGAAGLARPLFEEVPDRAAADDRLFARFHGLHWLCARLADERPLALLVDDAHWADEQSLRFVAYLQARIEEIPACAILAVRTGEAAAAPEALTKLIESEPLTSVRPPPLSPAAIAELVRGGLGEDTDDDVCVECARTTGGNPLLARQLISALEERRRGRRCRRRSDRRHGSAVGGPVRGRSAEATLADGWDRGADAGDPRRRCLPGGHRRGRGRGPPGGGGGDRRADRGRAPLSGPSAEVRPSDHPAGAPRLDPPGQAGATASGRRARAGARSGSVRACGRPSAGRGPRWPRW